MYCQTETDRVLAEANKHLQPLQLMGSLKPGLAARCEAAKSGVSTLVKRKLKEEAEMGGIDLQESTCFGTAMVTAIIEHVFDGVCPPTQISIQPGALWEEFVCRQEGPA
jgi:hypothetical protein